MNCFNNNRPKLSASDSIKNKKAQAMFKANVMDYQIRSTRGNGKCSNYNGAVGFYNNGRLRKTENFETLMNINRGSALCVDGAYKNGCLNLENDNGIEIKKGLNACGKNNNVKITLGRDNVYTIFSGFSKELSSVADLFSGFPVLTSYKFNDDGTFTTDPPYNTIPNDFNLTDIEYKGSLVIVDPKNKLFGSNFCSTDMDNKTQGPNKYLQYSSVNKFIIAEGHIYTNSGVGPSPCNSTSNVPSFESLVGFGNSFVNSGNLESSLGIGYVFKKCCGIGPNGESNWWTIYIRPLFLLGSNPDITSLGFFQNNNSINVTIDTIMGFKTTNIITKTPLITLYGAGDPCTRNLQSGNNSQQNYLVAYGVTSNKTRFNINPNIYKETNTQYFSEISSDITGFISTPISATTLADVTDIFMFDEKSGKTEKGVLNSFQVPNLGIAENLTEGDEAYKSVTNSIKYTDPAQPTGIVLDYNSGFDKTADTNNEGMKLFSDRSDRYKKILFKLNKTDNFVTFRGKRYYINNNKLPLKDLLMRSNLMNQNVIDNIFDDSNEDYLGMVYNKGTSIKHLLGNLKVNGKLSNNCKSNWLTTSKEITPLYYTNTIDVNYGTMDGYNLIINNSLTGNIWIILMFKTT